MEVMKCPTACGKKNKGPTDCGKNNEVPTICGGKKRVPWPVGKIKGVLGTGTGGFGLALHR